MKKTIKKIMAMLVVIIMALPTVGSFASTVPTNQLFFDSFNAPPYVEGTVDANTKTNPKAIESQTSYYAYTYNYANADKTLDKSSRWMAIEPTSNAINTYVSFERREDNNTNDISMKITNLPDKSVFTYPALFTSETLTSGEILHIGYDFKSSNSEQTGDIYDKPHSTVILSVQSNEYLGFFGKDTIKYALNEWNTVNIYFEKASGTWYLFVNNDFVAKHIGNNINDISNVVYRVSGSQRTADAVFKLDNICVSMENKIPEIPEQTPNNIQHYYNDFDTDYKVGDAITTDNNSQEVVTGTKGYFYVYNYATGEKNDGKKAYAWTYGGAAEFVERSPDDLALEFTPETAVDQMRFVQILSSYKTLSSGYLLHVGFDFKATVNNRRSLFSFKDTGKTQLAFESNGTVRFYGDVVDTYKADEWYNIDMYYNGIKWFLFIDGELRCVKSGDTLTAVKQYDYYIGEYGKDGIFYLDNLTLDEVKESLITDVNSEKLSIALVSTADNVYADNVYNIVYAGDGIIGENADSIDFAGIFGEGYSFALLTARYDGSAATTIEKGYVIKATKDGVTEYYKIADTGILNLLVKQNDTEISSTFETGLINATINVFDPEMETTPTLIIAQYIDGTLERVATGTFENSKARATLTVEKKEGTIKIILLENMTTIKPLLNSVKTFTAAK